MGTETFQVCVIKSLADLFSNIILYFNDTSIGTQQQTTPDTDTSIYYTVENVQDDATYTCKIVSSDTFTLQADIEKNGRFQTHTCLTNR